MRILYLVLALLTLAVFPVNAETVFYTLDGKKESLSSLQGKWVFINYWASWCGPCLEEIDALNQFYQINKNNAKVYAVNLDALPVSKLQILQKKLKMLYPLLTKDPGPELGFEYVRGVPATFIINPQGQLIDTVYGGQTLVSLEALRKSR